MDDIDRIREEKKRKMLESLQVIDVEGGSMETNGKPVQLSDSDFNEFVGKNDLVLVDCWAEWCGPCRMLEPTIEELAADNAGRAAIAKLNVDFNPAKAAEFRVSGIPTMLLFKHGKLVDKIVGYTEKAEIQEKLNRLM
jgi:thioredoxin 1